MNFNTKNSSILPSEAFNSSDWLDTCQHLDSYDVWLISANDQKHCRTIHYEVFNIS